MTSDDLAARLEAAGCWVSPAGYTDEHGAAMALAASLPTIRRWRRDGTGPPCRKLARWVYDVDELAAWIESREGVPATFAEHG